MQTFSPFSYTQCFIVPSQKNVGTRIPILFFASCPTAIFRTIGTIIIDTFNAVLWRRTHADISKEQAKIVPALGNNNTPATIARISSVLDVVTSGHHRFPNGVFGSLFASGRHAMFRRTTADSFVLQTPTMSAFASPQAIGIHTFFLATNTLADKVDRALSCEIPMQHSPVTKRLTSQINEIMGRHSDIPLSLRVSQWRRVAARETRARLQSVATQALEYNTVGEGVLTS